MHGRVKQVPPAELQVLTGAPLAWVHLLNVRRLWRLFGPTSVFASPGFGWTLPLTVLLLATAWYTDSAATPQQLPDAAADTPTDGDKVLEPLVNKQSTPSVQ
jgi:hypothetical protein